MVVTDVGGLIQGSPTQDDLYQNNSPDDLVGHDEIHAIALQPDVVGPEEKIIAAGIGYYTSSRGPDVGNSGEISPYFSLVRYLKDGSLDTTFGEASNGKEIATICDHNSIRGLVTQPDGKILVLGGCSNSNDGKENHFVLLSYNSDGTPNGSFGADKNGVVMVDLGYKDNRAHAIALQTDGKILVAGSQIVSQSDFYTVNLFLFRYNSDGTPDTSFGDSNDGRVFVPLGDSYYHSEQAPTISDLDMLLQSDGRILMGSQVCVYRQDECSMALTRVIGNLANIQIQMTATPADQTPINGDLKYQISVQNNGPSEAHVKFFNILTTDTLPKNVRISSSRQTHCDLSDDAKGGCSGSSLNEMQGIAQGKNVTCQSNRVLQCDVEVLRPNTPDKSMDFNITLTPTVKGTLKNIARITSDTYNAGPSETPLLLTTVTNTGYPNNTTSPSGPLNRAITIQANPTPARVNQFLIYNLSVTNGGNTTIEDVALLDNILGSGVTLKQTQFVTSTTSGQCTTNYKAPRMTGMRQWMNYKAPETTEIRCALGQLQAGETGKIKIMILPRACPHFSLIQMIEQAR